MFHVQISVGNGKHPWRDVSVDADHATISSAIARITSTGHAPSWVRVIHDSGLVVLRFQDGQMLDGNGHPAAPEGWLAA